MKSSSFGGILRRNQTNAESFLWSKIRNRQLVGTKFRRQHSIPPYIVDFVSLRNKLIIEVDGGGHSKEAIKLQDKERTMFLEREGYKVIRFWNSEVLSNIKGVLDVINTNLYTQPSSQPSPSNRAKENRE